MLEILFFQLDLFHLIASIRQVLSLQLRLILLFRLELAIILKFTILKVFKHHLGFIFVTAKK